MRTRKTPRKTLSAQAICEDSRGKKWDAELSDVSERGCRIEDDTRRVDKGDRLQLHIAGTGPHMVEVTWRRGYSVGLAFRHPLSPTFLEALLEQDWSAAKAIYPKGDPAAQQRRFV